MSGPIAHYKRDDLVEGLRVMQELGQGAASVIYLVRDPRTHQIWALKHVHRANAKDDRFLQQAIYESEVAAQLDHPAIRKIERCIKRRHMLVNLTDVFLVMEMLDGISMDRKPPKNLDDAISIFIQVADAMQHMHTRGFVHADMKPNNVLLVPTREGPAAKIIDLGQSCTINTVKPRIQGTPDYIAPEQVHRRPITPKTDVYNLGATMYWTLTARNIPTALPKGDSLVSKLDDHLIERAVPASSINPGVPQRLSDLIMMCIEVDPAQRPDMQFVMDRLKLIRGSSRAKKNDQSGAAPTPATDVVQTKGGSTVVGMRLAEPPTPGGGPDNAS